MCLHNLTSRRWLLVEIDVYGNRIDTKQVSMQRLDAMSEVGSCSR